ncbi:MAG: dihydropyrimidinase [Bacteroidales bacterium]|nr:dihydropyrimidinase [Bacteroidales bacterium]
MPDYLIKNGTIVSSEKTFDNELLISNGKIKAIDKEIKASNSSTKIIDAKGMYIFPGAIDPHVHMSLPSPAGKSSDDFLSGSIAAIAGGTTSLIDFVTPEKGESYLVALEKRKKEAENCLIDYGFHMSPTWWGESSADEIKKCIKDEGITSFKTYMAYKNVLGINNEKLIKVMDTVKKYDALVTIHCENGDLIEYLRNKFIKEGKISPKYHILSRPNETEAEAVNRAIIFSKYTKCPIYIVHVSAKESVEIIQKAQNNKQLVFAETCPHYLLLDDSVFEEDNFELAKYVLSPALRKKEDREVLWKAIKNGNIQTIGTDHCPFNLKGQKDKGKNDFTKIPNGAGGIEHRLSLLFTYGVLTNKISINQFVDIVATKPAKLFGLHHKKGDIKVGLDADIIIWNPDKEEIISSKNHFQNCDTNIYEGFKTKGKPEYVIIKGNIAFKNGKIFKENLKGEYLYRKNNILSY